MKDIPEELQYKIFSYFSSLRSKDLIAKEPEIIYLKKKSSFYIIELNFKENKTINKDISTTHYCIILDNHISFYPDEHSMILSMLFGTESFYIQNKDLFIEFKKTRSIQKNIKDF